MKFNHKVVLITGASSGIGAAIATKFAEVGAKLAIVGRNQDKLKSVAAKCGDPLVIKADITKDEDCKRIVIETTEHFGQLDVLINNAGISRKTNITDDNALKVFDRVMATNLRGTVSLTHLAVAHLIKTKGNIINISSIAGFRVLSESLFAYNTSKSALDHFAKSIALDLAPKGVRVNNINPGPVKTDIIENLGVPKDKEEAFWETMRRSTILDRISEPEEVANLVLYLASEKAKAITGVCYTIDNGMMLQSVY